MRHALALLALSGCVEPTGNEAGGIETSGETPAPESGRCVDEPDCVDLDTHARRWATPDGDVAGPFLADFDGDGIDDLMVSVIVNGVGVLARVAGPPTGTDDPLATSDWQFDTQGTMGPWESSGDGVPDLLAAASYARPTVLLMQGPLASGVPVEEVVVLGQWFADFNSDGITDIVRQPADSTRIELVYGPAARWSGPADLVISPSCEPGQYDEVMFSAYDMTLLPDATGDGVSELLLRTNGQLATCSLPYRMFPADAIGVIDPQTDPRASTWAPFHVGDQNGDGAPDFLIGENIYAGPLVSTPEGAITSPVLFSGRLDAVLLDIDIDADGSPDFHTPDTGGSRGFLQTGFAALHEGVLVAVGPVVLGAYESSAPVGFMVDGQNYAAYQTGVPGARELVVVELP